MLKTFMVVFMVCVFIEKAFSSITCANNTICETNLGSLWFCQSQGGNSSGVCEKCEGYYYLHNSSCEECPGLGESCETSQCCNNEYLACYENECICFRDAYCWLVTNMDEGDRERLQTIAQVILGIALLVTGTIVVVLFWNACRRRAQARQHSEGQRMASESCQSLNSVQRLVLLQLQDRPPPYNADLMSSWKNKSDISEPPPSYVEAVGLSDLLCGEHNPVFFIGGSPLVLGRREESTNNNLTNINNVLTNNQSIDPNSINVFAVSASNVSNSQNL